MRRVCELLGILVVLSACGGTGVAATVQTDAPTSRAGPFMPETPTQQERALYYGYGALLLEETPWNLETMGLPSWTAMLDDGALSACRSFHEGATTAGAMRSVLAASPVGVDVPAADDVDAYDLMSVFFIGGADAHCPGLIEDIYGSVFATGFDHAWREVTGGAPPSRPIRLP